MNPSSEDHSSSFALRRRTLLSAALAGGALAALAPSTHAARAMEPAPGGKTFYLRSNGDDSKSGLSDANAWASIVKLNAALADGTINRGDVVLLRRGDTFYGAVTAIPRAVGTEPSLSIGAYGTGARPQISCYKICKIPGAWIEHSSGVWRIDITAASGSYTGNTSSASTEVGFLNVDGVIRGVKRWSLAALASEWDFYSDDQYVYVRAYSNPAANGRSVRIAVDDSIIVGQSSLNVTELDLLGAGGHGFSGAAGMANVYFGSNIIREIGGSQLGPAANTTRYGNGVQLWIGSRGITIENNSISQVYDVAITCQGSQEGANLGWTDVIIRDNLVQNCTQSLETWSKGTNRGPGTGFVNCSFTRNTCIDAGKSWGAAVRPDKAGKSTHLLIYLNELPIDFPIEDNFFFNSTMNYAYFGAGVPTGFVSDRNTIRLQRATPLQYGQPWTIEDPAGWIAATGLEKHSHFCAIPDGP
ncbi:hypothetical protein [Jiangella endophytica]|uniref:hypothetical protein n=1 Tax=Jiangella endophytica TaxID=1623398 RepID=UPI000E34C444|nr:hypothetical protein [Jiangella endophytica]